ncbi:conserved hypothetical protein [Ricinus communis]|uniref:Uncharacterized protein n=1 Tax=Ricinus communis TaxID=3988 RepID=B9RNF4_RICCO|nr:conserved hypothetical protein [Ricinus communis]
MAGTQWKFPASVSIGVIWREWCYPVYLRTKKRYCQKSHFNSPKLHEPVPKVRTLIRWARTKNVQAQ